MLFISSAPIPAGAGGNGTQVGPGLIRYSHPTYQGYRLDWCLQWAAQCGEPAATAWCRLNNFDRADSWRQAPDIGRTMPTKVVQGGEICDKPFCDGFAEITCDAVEPDILFDFSTEAPSAKWTNAWQVLPFPGSYSDAKGFAGTVDNAVLEDKRIYRRVLETHPQRQPRGLITGRYSNITIPDQGAEFRAEIGFSAGAASTDGAYFEVRMEFPQYHGIPLRREYHKKYNGYLINDFSQDFSRFHGLTGTVILSVRAGKSSTRDRAVWVRPRLVSLEHEYAFASFVGGAIGSGRSGDRLLNAGGGKSGRVYGNVVLYLGFAHIQTDYSIKIDSYFQDRFMGTTNLGTIQAGQKEMWYSLPRTREGEWRESVVFNGTYVGELRYTVSQIGE